MFGSGGMVVELVFLISIVVVSLCGLKWIRYNGYGPAVSGCNPILMPGGKGNNNKFETNQQINKYQWNLP